MLPLHPPMHHLEPGYPVRSHLLADGAACQRLQAIIAASTLALALGGCAADGAAPVAPQTPPGQAQPAPALPGEAPATVPPPERPVQPPAEPMPLGGKPVAPLPPAEPVGRLRGDVVAPAPLPVPPAEAPQPAPAQPEPEAKAPELKPGLAEPGPMLGVMVAPSPPQDAL